FLVALRPLPITLVQAPVAKLPEIGFARFTLRRRVLWIFRLPEFELEMTTGRNLERVAEGVGEVGKNLAHFSRRFEIQLRLVTHSLLVLHFGTGVDAHQNVVCLVIAFSQKMDIIGCDQTEPKFFREFRQMGVANLLLGDAMIVQFEEEILRTKDIPIYGGDTLRPLQFAALNRGIEL